MIASLDRVGPVTPAAFPVCTVGRTAPEIWIQTNTDYHALHTFGGPVGSFALPIGIRAQHLVDCHRFLIINSCFTGFTIIIIIIIIVGGKFLLFKLRQRLGYLFLVFRPRWTVRGGISVDGRVDGTYTMSLELA